MLTVYELDGLCERLGLSREARAVIETIRSSPPTRRVRSAAGNVSVRYPSRKMGVTIQAESHRVELAGLYEYEHDPQVLEFYDQPPGIKLDYQTRGGRRVGVWHTPDYFVLRTDAIGWEEWKTEAGLERLVETMPHRYVREASSRWRCPPGERFAERFGLFYRLRSSAEIDWVLQRNLRFLEDYLGAEPSLIREPIAEAVLTLVEQQPGLQLDALVHQLDPASTDDVYALIAGNRLYVDLHTAPLAEPERVHLFRDVEIARACALVGMADPADRCLRVDAQEQLARASPADLREANRRHAVLTPYLAGIDAGPASTPARTVRDWLARWRAAESIHGCGYIGLLPHWSQRGNRLRKLPQATLALMDDILAADYERLKQKRKFSVYAALVRACEERGIVAPTYKTFAQAANLSVAHARSRLPSAKECEAPRRRRPSVGSSA